MTTVDGKVLTVQEVATKFRVSKMTIYRLVKNGDLESVRIGRGYRIPVEALDKYLNRPDNPREA